MKKLEYTVRLMSPGAPGNAEQAGQWCTPSFKLLIARWWPRGNDLPSIRNNEERGMFLGPEISPSGGCRNV